MNELLKQLNLDPDSFAWQDAALCKGHDTELFFDRAEADQVIADQVKSMCDVCPVRNACFMQARENREQGIWGKYNWDGKGKVTEEKINDHDEAVRINKLLGTNDE